MKGKCLLVCIMLIFVVGATMVGVVKSPSVLPKIYVDPLTNTASVGEYFSVNIKILGVSDLYTYCFYLRWDPDVLDVTNVTEGDFLSKGGAFQTAFTQKMYNVTGPEGYKGYVYTVDSLLGGFLGVSGSGTLATVTFLVKSEDGSALDLYETTLIDPLGSNKPYGMPHSEEDGYFNVSPVPKFHVVPKSTVDATLRPGDTLNINVTISDVVELQGFEFKLGYNTTVLNATDVTVTPFLNEPTSVDKGMNNTLGYLWVKVNSTAAEPVSGSGTLANVTYQIVGEGECILDLYQTKVNDTLSGTVSEHSPFAEDGYFNNIPLGHDIAVKRVSVFPYDITAGESVSINVTIGNEGGFDESFNVSISYDGTLIEAREDITLEAVTKKIEEFTWDTTGVPADTYTITAEASVVVNETDTDDNILVSRAITIKEQSGSSFLLYAAAGIGVVIAVAALIYFVKVRKPR